MVLTKRLLWSRVGFLDNMVETKVEDCLPCQANTDTTEHAPMTIQETPKKCTNMVSLDFSSKTPSNEYLLVANYERARFPANSNAAQ